MKLLKCHCGAVKAEINVSNKLEKILRCNCSLCKRKGAVMSMVKNEDFKIVKGKDKLSIYQFHTKIAKHYFCKICGIHTHNRPRIDPKIYGINIACIEDIKPFDLKNIPVNDGENHPHDKK